MKKQNTTTALARIEKTEVIHPSPTKKEIADALYAREFQKHNERLDAINKRKQEAEQAIVDKCRAWFKKHGQAQTTVEVNYYGYNSNVECKLVVPKEVYAEELKVRLAANVSTPHFYEEVVKQRIKVAVYGDRVNAMLKNADMVKALDAVLDRANSITV